MVAQSLRKVGERSSDVAYALFRILVGLMFFQHGAQKLFGWFGGKAVTELASLMGAAGVIEFFGGLLIALGLFTRSTALVAGVEMLYAFIVVHSIGNKTVIPIVNNGELALLYFATFLVLMTYGPGIWSLSRALKK